MSLFLGTNLGHGSAVAVLSGEGELLGAVEEGRLIGEKDSSRFPTEALNWVMNRFGDQKPVFWAEGWRPMKRLVFKGFSTTLRYGWQDRSYWKQRLRREAGHFLVTQKHVDRWSSRLGKVSWIGHHLAHAYSLLPAGLPAGSLVLVSDTTGERESVSAFHWSGQEMKLLASSPFPHSIGGAFHRLAHHVGFRGRTGPGKLMALSAFGHPLWREELRILGTVREGALRFDLKTYPAWHRTHAWLILASKLPHGDLRREIELCRNCYEKGLNLAASAQAWFTDITWECILQAQRIARERDGLESTHLGLVGGSALNCQANCEFLSRAPAAGFESVTVSPWSSDPGTAIGAAVAAFLAHRLGQIPKTCGPLLGPEATGRIERVSPEDIGQAAARISEGAVVALVSGRLEFGPRALGGRCLLADPRDSRMRDVLNRMKSRPEFMPVAPAVLEEDYGRYFLGRGSAHMAWTVKARPSAAVEIPAAVHRNGTSRVQVVGQHEPPLLGLLLRAFRERTGHGVLLLTSLNGAGEAIPADLGAAEAIARRLGADGLLWDGGWTNFETRS